MTPILLFEYSLSLAGAVLTIGLAYIFVRCFYLYLTAPPIESTKPRNPSLWDRFIRWFKAIHFRRARGS